MTEYRNQLTSKLKNDMEYQDVENYILDIPKFTKKNQFEETGRFYSFLGRPGESAKIIHVAGTNGKGSVCAYLQAMLLASRHSCGLFTSPHLITMRERVKFNNENVSELEFVECFYQIMDKCKEYQEAGHEDYHPTFFELVFFIAMIWYEAKRPEYIILETGLGGRLDTTNIVKNKKLSVITKIAYDHMEYLGDTLDKIAAEKAGIIEKNVPVIFYDTEENYIEVIKKTAENQNSKAYGFRKKEIFDVKSHEKFIDFSLDFKYYGCNVIRVSSGALYQAVNLGLSIRCLEELIPDELEGKKIELIKLLEAIKLVAWPCRLERFEFVQATNSKEKKCNIVLDGAHNPDGIEAFLESVKEISGNKKLLFSAVKDKNYEQMISLIAESKLFEEIVVTTIGGYRAGNAFEMADDFKLANQKCDANCMVTIIENAQEAFGYCKNNKNDDCDIYVAGSLYLAGYVRSLIIEK